MGIGNVNFGLMRDLRFDPPGIIGALSSSDLSKVAHRFSPIPTVHDPIPPQLATDFHVAILANHRGEMPCALRRAEANFEEAPAGGWCQRHAEVVKLEEAPEDLGNLELENCLHRVGGKRRKSDGPQT